MKDKTVKVAVVGLGKMGLSHLAMIRAHPQVEVAAICDTAGYVLDVLEKYTGMRPFTDFDEMLRSVALDAIVIATPTRSHATLVRKALDKGIHTFVEKPFCLTPDEAEPLAALAQSKGLVNQVGYHNRFVGAFREVKRLLDAKAIGEVTHVMAEAYGPVVLRPKGSTWRTQRAEGGGCLYDYAAHPINLVNWYLGSPSAVGGSILGKIFSAETDDEVYGTMYFDSGISAQLSVNWSDDSYRKMTTRITVHGSAGRIFADRQECQVFLRDTAAIPDGYRVGWNVRYTTDLTDPVWFYVRGEEYSAQLDDFVRAIASGQRDNLNSFASALETDRVVAMLIDDADSAANRTGYSTRTRVPAKKTRRFASLFGA